MAGLSGVLNIGYHGTSPSNLRSIANIGFQGGIGQSSKLLGTNMPSWGGTGKVYTAPNINVASTYGPRQIPLVQSAKHVRVPGGGIPGQTLTEAFKNIGKTKFGFETALSPEKATKGMTALERMKVKYPHSQTLKRLLETGTTAIKNPTNWARILGLPLSAITGILSPTTMGDATLPEYGSEEYKAFMAKEALFRRKQKQANIFKQIKEKQLAEAAAKAKADAAAAEQNRLAQSRRVILDPGSGGGGGGGTWHQQTKAKEKAGQKVAGPGFGKGAYFRDGGLINFYRYGGFI